VVSHSHPENPPTKLASNYGTFQGGSTINVGPPKVINANNVKPGTQGQKIEADKMALLKVEISTCLLESP